MMSLGGRIKAARTQAGLTQLEVARRLPEFDPRLVRTDAKNVGMWERDEAPRLAFYVVAAIAKATGVPLSFFDDVGGAAPPAAPAKAVTGARAARSDDAVSTSPSRLARTAAQARVEERDRDSSQPDRRRGTP